MTLELPVDDIHLEMLERVEEERGDAKQDLANAVENIIHDNYQQVKNGQS